MKVYYSTNYFHLLITRVDIFRKYNYQIFLGNVPIMRSWRHRWFKLCLGRYTRYRTQSDLTEDLGGKGTSNNFTPLYSTALETVNGLFLLSYNVQTL